MKKKLLALLVAVGSFCYTIPALAVSKLPMPAGIQFIPTRGNLMEKVVVIINWGLSFVGLIAVIFLIYGGFKYITSSGNEKETEAAKNIIVYAIIGIVVILLSFLIVIAVSNIL